MRARPWVIVPTVLLVFVQPAGATTANDICPSTANPCVVATDRVVLADSILDFGTRALDIQHGASLTVSGGSMTILAGSLRIEAGGALLGAGADNRGETITVTVTGGIRIEASGTSKGKIVTNGDFVGGEIDLKAGGDIVVDGTLTAKASSSFGDGGRINIPLDGTLTGNVTINSAVSVTSGRDGAAGQFVVKTTGTILIDADVDVSGGDGGGGTLDLESGGDLTTTGTLDLRGGGASGDGGDATLLSSNGDIRINGPLYGVAAGSLEDGGGSGANVEIGALGAGHNITLGATMVLDGASPDGEGGSLVLAAGGSVVQMASLSMDGRGGDSNGGDMRVTAAGAVTLAAIDLSGGDGGGGLLEINDQLGTVSLTGEINTDGGADAAGDIAIVAGSIVVSGKVHSNGTGGGAGGTNTLQACNLNVTSTGQVKATGPSGQNALRAGGTMTVAGVLTAGPGTVAGGLPATNRLEYRDAGSPPVLTGSTISPAPVVVLNPGLPSCSAVCGNGTLDPGELCDDGNAQSCDGCSATCRPEVCGDRKVECTEECDDGPDNGTTGDPCDSTCHIVGGLRIMPGLRYGERGCYFEWALVNPHGALHAGFPDHDQHCIDGDPLCDFDGQIDGTCTFRVSGCLAVTDARLPDCQPTGISEARLYTPSAVSPSDGIDALNASTLVAGLKALGVTVKAGSSTVLQTGTPVTQRDVCTARMSVRVPHPPGHGGTRSIRADAVDLAGHDSRSSWFDLDCDPNPATCGNSVTELGESCDDGNTQSCDGCAANCHTEVCGNGILDCGEECDDGPLNGTPGDTCSAICGPAPPPLRIAGGGRRSADCPLEWSFETATPILNKDGTPSRKQACVDGDPECDFDPTPGRCGIHLWACFGGADAAAQCPAQVVTGIELRRPSERERRPGGVALREALLGAFSIMPFPIGPGELCSRRMSVVLPARRSKYRVRARALLADGRDSDSIRLQCLVPGS